MPSTASATRRTTEPLPGSTPSTWPPSSAASPSPSPFSRNLAVIPPEFRRENTADDVLALLRARVEERLRDGTYPADLEDELRGHFESLEAHAVGPRVEQLREAIEQAAAAAGTFTASRIEPPGDGRAGDLRHRAVNRLVHRHLDGVLEQVGDYAGAVARMGHAQLDAFRDLLAHMIELERRLEAVEGSAVLRSAAGWPRRHEDADPAWLRRVAERFPAGASVLVEGPGALPPLLEERGVDVTAVDDAVRALRDAEDGSVAAAALAGVVDQLDPAGLVELVALLASRLAPGGAVVLDGDGRSVHPGAVTFLLTEAGFDPVALEWEAPPTAEQERAEHLAQALAGGRRYLVSAGR